MLISNLRPRAAAAGWLLATALVGSAAAQVPRGAAAAGNGCVLSAIALAEDGEDMLLEISTEGAPSAVGARGGEGGGVLLDLTGCVAGPELSDLTFAESLVSAIRLVQWSGAAGPATAVEVETRRGVDYTVRSSARSVRVRLQPSLDAATRVAEPRESMAPEESTAPSRPVRVLEPLPLPPMQDARASEEPEERDPSKIADLVERWSRAWSDQRVEDYLSFYAAAYRPAESSRAEWEARRRERLAAPSFVEIGIDSLLVRFEGRSRAAASFWQSYTSDLFSDLVYKTLTWIDEDGAWKIVDESVVTPPAIVVPELPVPEPPPDRP